VITFLSVFDVHVQRAPLPGTVIASKARAGRKLAAFRADVDRVNENHLTVLRSEGGVVVGVRQIAGLLARRVVPYLRVGQSVQRGELMGVIKFGSRVDVLLPSDYQILVSVGDRVRCGETPLAAPLAGPIAGPIAGKSERS
jgi:phosphatidylserine decarboxylase